MTHQSTQSRTWARTFSSPRSQWNCHSTQLQAEGSLSLLPLIFLPVSKSPKSFYHLFQFYSQGKSYPDSKSWSTYAHSGYTPLFSFLRLLSTSLNPKPYMYFFKMSFLYTTSTNAACHVKVEVESKTLNSTPVSLRYPSHTPVSQMQPIVRNLEWNKRTRR